MNLEGNTSYLHSVQYGNDSWKIEFRYYYMTGRNVRNGVKEGTSATLEGVSLGHCKTIAPDIAI